MTRLSCCPVNPLIKDVSETNVRATISRKLIDEPERKVMYPFQKFPRIVPDSRRKRR